MRSSSWAARCAQGIDEWCRQRQGPAAAIRLRLLVDEALSGDPVQAAPDAQRSRLQIDVRPPQAEASDCRSPMASATVHRAAFRCA
jgi:hypothetical protein